MLLCSFFIPTLSVHVQQQPRPALLLLPSNRGTEDSMIKQKKKKGPWTLMILKTSAGIFVMATYPRLKSMKLYATFPLSLLLCFLIFSLVMAEEDQRKEIPQEQSLPSIEQQSVTIRVAENLVSDGVDATIDRSSLGLNLPAARREWPDVVGMSVEEAEKRIKEDMPMAIFQVVLPNYFVTMDYNLRRVRLYVDSSAKVVRPPKTG